MQVVATSSCQQTLAVESTRDPGTVLPRQSRALARCSAAAPALPADRSRSPCFRWRQYLEETVSCVLV